MAECEHGFQCTNGTVAELCLACREQTPPVTPVPLADIQRWADRFAPEQDYVVVQLEKPLIDELGTIFAALAAGATVQAEAAQPEPLTAEEMNDVMQATIENTPGWQQVADSKRSLFAVRLMDRTVRNAILALPARFGVRMEGEQP